MIYWHPPCAVRLRQTMVIEILVVGVSSWSYIAVRWDDVEVVISRFRSRCGTWAQVSGVLMLSVLQPAMCSNVMQSRSLLQRRLKYV